MQKNRKKGHCEVRDWWGQRLGGLSKYVGMGEFSTLLWTGRLGVQDSIGGAVGVRLLRALK